MADAQKPAAWAVEDSDGVFHVDLSFTEADRVHKQSAHGEFAHKNPRMIPLYSQPQPTLTDAERDAAGSAVMTFDSLGMMDAANVLRGLLERLGGERQRSAAPSAASRGSPTEVETWQ